VVVVVFLTAVVLLALAFVVGFRCSFAAVVLLALALVVGLTSLNNGAALVLLAFALVMGLPSLDTNAAAGKSGNKV
jgi:hypothetical protein